MQHFRLSPPGPIAALVITFELGASIMIVSHIYRRVGAIVLGGLTFTAVFLCKRFWDMALARLGEVGGFLLVVWHDIRKWRS
jgi:uncharacterized membrane protein YphA (DoxX/SURF4 family)